MFKYYVLQLESNFIYDIFKMNQEWIIYITKNINNATTFSSCNSFMYEELKKEGLVPIKIFVENPRSLHESLPEHY